MTRKKKSRVNFSKLEQHKRSGKKLIPPLLQIPKMKSASWQTDRLPEMLWAVLLIGTLEREVALEAFRRIANYVLRLEKTDQFEDVSLTGMAALAEPIRESAIQQLINGDEKISKALAPLLLIKEIPAYSSWKKFLPEPAIDDWRSLGSSVVKTLDHQSQESTDCRWIRILVPLLIGRMQLPSEELFREIADYPNFGDMRGVRPFIRASEISSPMSESNWPAAFWYACMNSTGCTPLGIPAPPNDSSVGYTGKTFATAWIALWERFHKTRTTTAADPKHETVFSLALYSLILAAEIIRGRAENTVTARLVLRTIVECHITLAYLMKLDQPELWASYRAYGIGQAKLAFLKVQEMKDVPAHINLQELEVIANEDAWIEFVPIDVGHWEKSNLREMSIQAGVKDIYDRFYSWTSNFSHGHWSAARSSVLDTCANPLHRLHRIPRETPATLPSVIPDVADVVDRTLQLINAAFPGEKFQFCTKVELASNQAPKMAAEPVPPDENRR